MTEKDARYWDEVARTWQAPRPNTLRRVYNDAVNTALFSRWLPSGRADLLLKTDLFNESLGEGLYPLLNALAKNLVGIDISGLSVHAANFHHNGLHGAQANVRHLPFADDTFDVIVSNSTLDHFESSDEIVASLRELHRVLRVGGQLLLTLDNLSNPVIALRSLLPYRFLNRLNIIPYYVGTTFEPHRLCRSIEHLGFEVLEVQAIMHFPRMFTMLLCRVLERLIMNSAHKRFLHLLMSFEHMSRWPTRFLTGYFVAVRATKR